MANNTVTKKTLILHFQDDPGSERVFTYEKGDGDVYINSNMLSVKDDASKTKNIKNINGYYVVYFSSKSGSLISTKLEDASTYYEYIPVDSEDASTYSDVYKKMKYKRLNMMIDDDTSYSILRVNPKLTGNVKVVVDSESNMYLDTFKVSLGLSQNKYRHIPINPSEYYGRTLMSKMRSIPTDDFYKIEDSCYDLFATANDLNEQYYDKYNYGVRTNTDKMYSENFALLAPLCIRKVLPDFFLIFKIKNYENLFDTTNKKIIIDPRNKFIDFNNCELIKSFDFREGTKLGSYIRRILNNNNEFVGDIYAGSDYDHFNIFNGISLERGVVSRIYEETTQERNINNQVSMNDWYTLGFQRNHIVSKDIINFEFMFDDTTEKLFSLPTYFGVYVRLNGEDETFTCIDIDSSNAIFDSSIHGLNFNPSNYPTIIYGLSTDKEFKRLKNNIRESEEAKSHKLEAYKSIVTVDTYDISDYNNGIFTYVSNKLNDVLDPGEHYRIVDHTNHIIYEVIVSNFFYEYELSDISYTQSDIKGESFQIRRISILNTEYRSNIDDNDKPEIIKEQLNLITKAFNRLSNNIKAYDDGESSFSLLYKKNSTDPQTVIFEKISSICGFNKENDDRIKNTDPDKEYIDKSSYIFGCDSIKKIIIDPTSDSFDTTDIKVYYPIGFESLGTRVAYCVNFMDIVYNENGETMILVNDNIQKSISSYKTVLYITKFNENKLYKKNIRLNYLSIEGNFVVTKQTDPMYSIIGFGYQESYIIKFDINPLININGKLQFYQNFPINVGICSIFPLKDYYFDVLDKDSVFFVKNENNPEEGTKVGGDLGEYTHTETNVYDKQIVQNSEEFIADYCDKFQTYNVDTSGFGYMSLGSIEDLGVFLGNMQNNGHNKFDISLISPYCCKWRLLGTDATGNRMRVMYNFTKNKGEVKSYGNTPFLIDSESYWIPNNEDKHIGFVSSKEYNSEYTKYISDYYDEDETGGFNSYICNHNENGALDDLLYRKNNDLNKFSKIYKYGDNSIEFVSCGVKARIKSTDKSKINLSKYIGYSVILLSMSGNNANQPGTYELFIDETKEQAALIIYNGLSSDYNKIQKPETLNAGIYRIKHSIKLSDCIYTDDGLKIKDDGYLTSITGIDDIVNNHADIFLISKPTKNGEKEEQTLPPQIIIYGKIKNINVDISTNDRYIILDKDNLLLANDSSILTIESDYIIKTLNNGNNNVDAYINTDSSINEQTRINSDFDINYMIAANSLSLSQLKSLTPYYSITIKNKNETKKYNNIASILSIDLVDPFEIKRENTNYEIVTSGYTHPSYASPVMKDIFKFDYDVPIEISDEFLTWFDGCNIMLKGVDSVNQTWMKKMIDIDNTMKGTDKDASTMIIKKDTRYEITMIPDNGKSFFIPPKINKNIYQEVISDSSVYDSKFIINNVILNEYDLPVRVCYVDKMYIKPDNTYKSWKGEKYTLDYPSNFKDMYLEKNDGSTYSGTIITDSNLSLDNRYQLVTNTLSGDVFDASSLSIIDELQFDSSLYSKIGDSSICFYFDGKDFTNRNTKLYLRTFENIDANKIDSSLYFVTSKGETIKCDSPTYQENGKSNLIFFEISRTENAYPCTDASIYLYSDDIDSTLHATSGTLKNTTTESDFPTHINFKNAIDKSNLKKITFLNQSHSVTLLRNHDPLIGYWYTNICRLFSKYDTYVSYYGAFSGFEKNTYIASRGINLKTKDQNGNIIHGIDLTTWVDTIKSSDNKKIVLNITTSIINFIDSNSGYTDSWNKNQEYIDNGDMSYSNYKSKYIENTILNLIDINNNTKFILYVDESSDSFEFLSEKPSDISTYKEMNNVENTLVLSENRYYMNIENLEPHKYYAEMIITF